MTKANINDREGTKCLLRGKNVCSVKKIWADMGYQGKRLKEFVKLYDKNLECCGLSNEDKNKKRARYSSFSITPG